MATLIAMGTAVLTAIGKQIVAYLLGGTVVAIVVWYLKKLVTAWLVDASNTANEKKSEADQRESDWENQQDSPKSKQAEDDVRKQIGDGDGPPASGN